MTLGFDRGEYVRLLDAFPPIKVRSDDQAEEIETRIEELLAKPRLSAAERAYVDLLSDLLAAWEDAHIGIPDIHGVELIKILLKERGLRQRDLVGVFATESIVSEVLAGRRDLTRAHIEQLAAFFHISPAAFFPTRPSAPTPTAPDRSQDRTSSKASSPEHALTQS